MPVISDEDLVSRATAVLMPRRLSPTVEVGEVGCALVTASGAVHVGVCIDATCGIGFCAEHAAIASMVTHRESRIETIVAVDSEGNVLPPCGRCRELICQIDSGNLETRILLPDEKVKSLRQLLPDHWLDSK
ncbi:cytidine deaminase family protein [Methylocystis sp. S23]|jgi:cytidine deaminase